MKGATKAAGRGARSFLVTATEKFKADFVAPLNEQLERQARAEIRPLLRKSLKEIRAELNGSDPYARGIALEALGIKVMRLIDFAYVATRVRGTATGGAEVALVFESTRLTFSRWQVRCMNTGRVGIDHVAKEVGFAQLLKSNVVVMVSTGEISSEARFYANKVMAASNLCVIMVDDDDLDIIEASPAAIVDVLDREAHRAIDLKNLAP